jgi:hypothetical protein
MAVKIQCANRHIITSGGREVSGLVKATQLHIKLLKNIARIFTRNLMALWAMKHTINLPILLSISTLVLITTHPTNMLYFPYWCTEPKLCVTRTAFMTSWSV